MESRWVTAGDLKVYARAWICQHPPAQRVPVVLVHGLVVSSLYMMPTAERLAADYTVFAPDLPGFGKSDKPPRALNVAELSEALRAWMDAMSISRAVLVGNSMGCQVIVDLAARSPRRVEGLVLLGPTVDPGGRSLLEQFKRLLIDAPHERFSILYAELRGLFEAGLKRSWLTARYALEDRIEDKLPHVRAPTLVVRGSRDTVSTQSWCEQVSKLLPRGRLVIIPGAPHGLNYTTPDEVTELIREFIEDEAAASETVSL